MSHDEPRRAGNEIRKPKSQIRISKAGPSMTDLHCSSSAVRHSGESNVRDFVSNHIATRPPLPRPCEVGEYSEHFARYPSRDFNGARSVARRVIASIALAFVTTAPLMADDWPQWGGPKRDIVWRETEIVDTFPTNGLLPRVWATPIGEGYAG